MRLFVAIDLDDGAREAIARAQERLAKALDTDRSFDRSLKWVKPSHMHLTLAFLGEVADQIASGIADAFSTEVGVRSFAAVFQGLGVFPPRGAPRTLWLGVGEGAEAIVEVQGHVAARLDRAGVELDRRPFHPHLTLARWRSSRPDAARHALSAGPHAHTPIARVDVEHITLYQSRLTPAGPVHTALARATLT